MDYIFYRTAKFFYKEDGSSVNRALLLLSAFYSLLIVEIVTIVIICFLSREELSRYTTLVKFIGGAIFIIIFFLNKWKYKGRYMQFREKWSNEEIGVKQLRGFLVVVALILPWIIMIMLGIREKIMPGLFSGT